MTLNFGKKSIGSFMILRKPAPTRKLITANAIKYSIAGTENWYHKEVSAKSKVRKENVKRKFGN